MSSSKLTYDPKLREAMAEIKEIMKKYDVGGYVALGSKSHYEFAMLIDVPSWSMLRWTTENGQAHLKIYAKSQKENTDATVGLLVNLKDLCALGFGQLQKCEEQLRQVVEIEHTPFGKGISNDDRGEG